jgi:hypothetical protein
VVVGVVSPGAMGSGLADALIRGVALRRRDAPGGRATRAAQATLEQAARAESLEDVLADMSAVEPGPA